MSKVFRVGIKYCGGCNPHIERKQLVQAVREKFNQKPVQFVGYAEKNLDLLLNVSGCGTDCVGEFESEKNIPRLAVAGKIFNYRQWEWGELAEKIAGEIGKHIAVLEEEEQEV